MRNKLFESSELIAQNFLAYQHHIGRMRANGFDETLAIFAFGKNPNVILIGNRTPHSDKRERQIVRDQDIDIRHTIIPISHG